MVNAEHLMRKVIDACTDCDICRYLMDTNCLFFPEIYRLWDNEQETGVQITSRQLRRLADLCNFCALCPCPNIREDIIAAKTLFIDRDGLGPHIRTLEDVERVGKLCGAFPQLSNFLLQNKITGSTLKKTAGIHARRKIPIFPSENFPSWAKRQDLCEKKPMENRRKVAYFAGCTARHLFPDVPKAAVEVLERNHIAVYYPEQICCGMPSMLEGDRDLTLTFAERTISHLTEVVADGYDIVCSCPTCGYMLKNAISERAYYSNSYQDLVGSDERCMKIPENISTRKAGCGSVTNVESSRDAWAAGDNRILLNTLRYRLLDRSIYGKVLKDDGYFSGIDPLKRIQVAENTYDLGEYLLALHGNGELTTRFKPVSGTSVYYPPCHLREQGVGMPYADLLALIPDFSMTAIHSTAYCCGLGGIIGFKRDFHNASIKMGSRLMGKIKQLNPDHLVTDCLSCRMQFNQMGNYPVVHPIELLAQSTPS